MSAEILPNEAEILQACEICVAILKGNQAALEHLVHVKKYAVNCKDYDGRTPLHIACAVGNLTAAKLLVEYGAELNATDRWGGTPTEDAIHHKRRELVEFMRECGGLCSEAYVRNFSSLLIDAASHGDLAAYTSLVGSAPDPTWSAKKIVELRDYDNRSSLHVAASKGHKQLVEFLIRKHANVNSMDRWGNTPLQEAHRSGHKEVEDMLLAAGATSKEVEFEPHIPPMISMLARLLSAGKTTHELFDSAEAILTSLSNNYPLRFGRFVRTLPPKEQRRLKERLKDSAYRWEHHDPDDAMEAIIQAMTAGGTARGEPSQLSAGKPTAQKI